jgi:ComF family protein
MFSTFEKPDPEFLNERLAHTGNFEESDRIIAAYAFEVDGITQSIIHHFKYYGMPKLARRCGQLLATTHADVFEKIDHILPVPLHRTRISTRGYNQSEMLARGIFDVTKKPVLGQAYAKRLRPTKSQTKLSIEERQENVKGVFALKERALPLVKGKRVLILDDVLTTGATLSSFAKAVRAAEPAHITYLSFAAAEFN